MSEQMDGRHFRENLLELLDETVLGVDESADGTRYLDRSAGFIPTLASLDENTVSTPPFPGATTVVAQLRHTVYYAEILLQFSRGKQPAIDWPGSFRPSGATSAEYAELANRLKAVCSELRADAEATSTWSDDLVGTYMNILVHTAYHLGSLRQLIRAAAHSSAT